MKLVIADDHKLVARLLEKYLGGYPNIDVVSILANGKELIKYLGANEVDVVICDVMMPQMDGLRTLMRIKEKFENVKVIMLSSSEEKWIISKAVRYGCSGYISKKCKKEDILEAVNNVNDDTVYYSPRIKAILADESISEHIEL